MAGPIPEQDDEVDLTRGMRGGTAEKRREREARAEKWLDSQFTARLPAIKRPRHSNKQRALKSEGGPRQGRREYDREESWRQEAERELNSVTERPLAFPTASVPTYSWDQHPYQITRCDLCFRPNLGDWTYSCRESLTFAVTGAEPVERIILQGSQNLQLIRPPQVLLAGVLRPVAVTESGPCERAFILPVPVPPDCSGELVLHFEAPVSEDGAGFVRLTRNGGGRGMAALNSGMGDQRQWARHAFFCSGDALRSVYGVRVSASEELLASPPVARTSVHTLHEGLAHWVWFDFRDTEPINANQLELVVTNGRFANVVKRQVPCFDHVSVKALSAALPASVVEQAADVAADAARFCYDFIGIPPAPSRVLCPAERLQRGSERRPAHLACHVMRKLLAGWVSAPPNCAADEPDWWVLDAVAALMTAEHLSCSPSECFAPAPAAAESPAPSSPPTKPSPETPTAAEPPPPAFLACLTADSDRILRERVESLHLVVQAAGGDCFRKAVRSVVARHQYGVVYPADVVDAMEVSQDEAAVTELKAAWAREQRPRGTTLKVQSS
eukprot:TRINITY_DN13787_c0_g1_i2.p1 TRINITY_DN13787_c0_g1~~TRINITY_DN13787_c0_g1_i2.p1  ORF type:complete len:572 (+),score=123.65 TRINITY_DN13787_c0_g1_i2:48-1718(+)